MNIYHGNILFSQDKNTLLTYENSYIAIEDGKVEGIYADDAIAPPLPEKYKDLPIIDFGDKLIIPAFSDLHVHAPQYAQRGIAMDLLLSDWLNQYTFPQEAKFANMDYARPMYDAFVDDLVKNGTFHASVLATIHPEATEYLLKRMEEKGLGGFVGKVNMDMDSPDFLCETTEESLYKTEQFLEVFSGRRAPNDTDRSTEKSNAYPRINRTATPIVSPTVKPILTPRFAPTCSPKLMEGLGKLGKKYSVGMQTHIVESKWEAMQAKKLFPDCSCDTEIYEKYGLMENGPVIAAHFIFPSKDDIRILKKYDGIAVHCPDATVNVIAGIMPFANLEDQGVKIALGSDVAAGSSVALYRQIASTVRLSKLKEFYEPEKNKTVSFESAFYHATKEAGSIFGKTGSFEVGYAFDALVIDNMSDPKAPLTPEQSLERFCYAGDDRNIYAKFILGKRL